MPPPGPGSFASSLPAVVIVLPAILAMAALLVPRRALAVLALPGALAVSALVVLLVNVTANGELARTALGGWQPPLGIVLRADGLAAIFLLMTAVIMFAVLLSLLGDLSPPPEDGDAGARAHPPVQARLALVLFLWAGANTVFLSVDLFNLYVALEIASLSGVAMVALAGGSAALRAQMRYFLFAIAGSLFYLLGVALLYGQWGVLDLALLAERAESTPPTLAAVALMTFGLLLKTAVWPLHFWLPPAHSSAPAPASALLSALVVKAPLYLLLRLWFEAFPGVIAPAGWSLLGALGAMAVLWGSLLAVRQERLKLMIAYSTVAQLGYMMFVFPLARAGDASEHALGEAAALLMVSHGIAKASMFLSAGALLAVLGGDERERLVGASRRAPLPLFALALAALSVMALPPSGGFVAKWLLLRAAIDGGHWLLAAVLVTGGLLAAAYVLRFLLPGFRPVPEAAPRPAGTTGFMGASAMILALSSLALGFAGEPAIRLIAVGLPVSLGGAP